jgi:hypothetical protein
VRSPLSDVEIPESNLADFVWQNVDQHADLPALVSIPFLNFILYEIPVGYLVSVPVPAPYYDLFQIKKVY